MKVKSYEELIAWQKTVLLTKMVYGVQKQLPKERETPHQAVPGEACAARAKPDLRC